MIHEQKSTSKLRFAWQARVAEAKPRI